MWLGILATLFIGLIICFVLYFLVYPELDFNGKKFDKDEYRHIVLGEQYDSISYYETYGSYKNKMDEKGEKKYAEYCEKIEKKGNRNKKLSYLLPIIILVSLICFFGWLGANVNNNKLREEIASFESAKITYETALKDEDLTGLERIEIIGKIAEQNQWLASKKVEVSHWYNFHLDKSILEIEPINVKMK